MTTASAAVAVGKPGEPILVVDDDPVQHTLIKKYLRDRQVRFAFSPLEALDILQREDILLVILDLYMPEMDGLEMLRRVKRLNGMVQVIVITASERLEDLLMVLEAGANDFLLKPLSRKALEDALENALARIKRWKDTLLELFLRKKEAGRAAEPPATKR